MSVDLPVLDSIPVKCRGQIVRYTIFMSQITAFIVVVALGLFFYSPLFKAPKKKEDKKGGDKK